MARGTNLCDYVTRAAGRTADGQPLPMDGYGDHTQYCGRFGREVSKLYRVKRPGTTAVYDTIEGTAVRCPQHSQE